MGLLPNYNAIEIDRKDFTLKLYHRPWNHSKAVLLKEYGIAVGMKGLETPKGYYTVLHRSKCPEWMVPDSEWAIDAGYVVGTVYDCHDPENPIKARWIGVDDDQGVGIHGTASDDSIGTAASHGCIRMHIPDVIELYEYATKGTWVHIQ